MATEVQVREMVLVDPTGVPMPASTPKLAPRPKEFRDKVLGLMQNSKPNSDKVLAELGNILKQEMGFREVFMVSKHHASLPPKPEVVNELVQRADVVVTGVGD